MAPSSSIASASSATSSLPTRPLKRAPNASARSRASVSIASTASGPRPSTSGSRSQLAASSFSSTVALTRPRLPRAVSIPGIADLPTPLEEAPPELSAARPLFLKREDVHELGAFKWRGALPALDWFRGRGADGVVTASTGNHGAAAAWAAARTGVRAVIFVPAAASESKVALLEQLGAELHRVGADLDESKDLAREHAAANGLAFFEDGAEPAQFGAYEAIGKEISRQLGRAPAKVIVPVGNGA